MAISFEAVEFGPVRFIGKEVVVAVGKTARKHWKEFLKDGSNELLQAMPERVSPLGDCIGWMGGYDSETKTFSEIPGIFTKPDTTVPEGFAFRDIPACLMGICSISGDTQNLERGAHNKAVKAMKEQGYEPDYSLGFSMEYYSYEKFASVKKEEGAVFTFAYYLPCKAAPKAP